MNYFVFAGILFSRDFDKHPDLAEVSLLRVGEKELFFLEVGGVGGQMKALFGCFVNDEVIVSVFKFNDFVLHYKVINWKR